MSCVLYNSLNMPDPIEGDEKFNLIYADMIYDNRNFDWIGHYFDDRLSPNGVFIIQTDYHTVGQIVTYMERRFGIPYPNNWLIYKQEWGGVPRKGFPQKHDDILVYSNSLDYKWHGERIYIPKKTAGTKLDKKGTGLKTPCSVFDDLGNFSTISRERVKLDGHNIEWQKPLNLMHRLLAPYLDHGDKVLDLFLGSGTTGVWCRNNGIHFVGIESDKVKYEIAKERIENEKISDDYIF